MNKKTMEPKKRIEELYLKDVEVIYSEELSRKLEESKRQIKEGKVYTAEEVFEELYEEFGIQ